MVKLTQAPRGDATRLETVLERLLMTHQARATAICHVREKFFLQVFGTNTLNHIPCVQVYRSRTDSTDSTVVCSLAHQWVLGAETIIREAACESPGRGLLLLRVRDELRLSIEASQTLYHNSIAFGRKKAVQAEVGIAELEAEVQRLEHERERLSLKKRELAHTERFRSEHADEERRKRQARQAQTREFLQTQRLELETFLTELKQDK